MTTIKEASTEICPDEPPDSYPHILGGDPCWCKPVKLGKVIVHRPRAECEAEAWEQILTVSRSIDR
jgi:hypothetical protein